MPGRSKEQQVKRLDRKAGLNCDPSRWYDQIGSQKASDFYHRYKEDIATMASFGLNTFRFTIQWDRFMKDPLKGIVDPKAIAYYQDVIKTIKRHGIKPIISLEH